MAYEVIMPQLGLTMEEGTVSQWMKHEGDAVKIGDVLAEITTDKLTNEIESEHDGILLKIIAQEGEDIPVRGVIAYIGEPGEAVGVDDTAAGDAETPEEVPVSEGKEPSQVESAQKESAQTAKDRVRISPLARKTAAELGITDFACIEGSGTSGRIIQKDIIAASERLKAASAAVTPSEAPAPFAFSASEEEKKAPEAAPEMMEGDTVVKLSGMRKVVSERMFRSHAEIPPVTQNTKADVTELMKFKQLLLDETGRKYTVNDLILKATAKALRGHPEILVSFDNGRMIRRSHVNIGMAVALDTGLIVPVIRDADRLSLDALSDTARDLSGRARSNRLLPDEYRGSTFSVSNMGMFDVESFTPIINQPDAAILGICAVQDELVMADDGSISKRKVMRLSLTFDHRLIDGATAAKFVIDLRDLIQNPLRIVL